MTIPKAIFPYRSVSQRLALDYDEVDELLDSLFANLFQDLFDVGPVSDHDVPSARDPRSDARRSEAV